MSLLCPNRRAARTWVGWLHRCGIQAQYQVRFETVFVGHLSIWSCANYYWVMDCLKRRLLHPQPEAKPILWHPIINEPVSYFLWGEVGFDPTDLFPLLLPPSPHLQLPILTVGDLLWRRTPLIQTVGRQPVSLVPSLTHQLLLVLLDDKVCFHVQAKLTIQKHLSLKARDWKGSEKPL